MRLVLIAFFLLVPISKTWAHGNSHHYYDNDYYVYDDIFEEHLHTAYAFPNQILAAAEWRFRHPQIDVRVHLGDFMHFGWHPSVIALLQYPHFLEYVHHHPKWIKENKWRKHQWHSYYPKKRHYYKKNYYSWDRKHHNKHGDRRHDRRSHDQQNGHHNHSGHINKKQVRVKER